MVRLYYVLMNHPWRRDYFPLYKANRKKSREKDDKDWGLIFDTLHKVKEEIKENFPYRFMYVENCEMMTSLLS